MRALERRIGRHPVGVWLGFLALLLLMTAWMMQSFSLLDWGSAVNLGLQNERLSGDPAERAWALESRGVAAADMLWPLPLTLVALIGLARRRFFGLATGLMVLSIGVYFPLVFALQRWSTFQGTAILAILLFTVPSLLGIVGLMACHRHIVEEEENRVSKAKS